jgi:cytochrome P450
VVWTLAVTIIPGGILGMPGDDRAMFLDWPVKIVETGAIDPEGAAQAEVEIFSDLSALLDARRAHPRDDILTFLLTADLDGVPLTDEPRLGVASLLLVAGTETTAKTLGIAPLHLAAQPAVGAHIARMEMRVGLEEFLAAPPDFQPADPDGIVWKAGPIRDPRQLALSFAGEGPG